MSKANHKPSKKKRKRKHGFRSRRKGKKKNILKRRRKKGRKNLSA